MAAPDRDPICDARKVFRAALAARAQAAGAEEHIGDDLVEALSLIAEELLRVCALLYRETKSSARITMDDVYLAVRILVPRAALAEEYLAAADEASGPVVLAAPRDAGSFVRGPDLKALLRLRWAKGARPGLGREAAEYMAGVVTAMANRWLAAGKDFGAVGFGAVGFAR